VVTHVDHIGIAVRDLAATLSVWQDGVGLRAGGEEEVPEQKVRVAFMPCGEARLELLQSTAEDGPIARFIESRGEGVHHIALAVDDIEQALERARAAGLRLIDERPRRGAGNALVAFVHPKATHGVLLELVERGEGGDHQ